MRVVVAMVHNCARFTIQTYTELFKVLITFVTLENCYLLNEGDHSINAAKLWNKFIQC